jgi:hypothetical protein
MFQSRWFIVHPNGGAMMVLQGVPLSQKMVAAIQNPMATFPRLSEVSTL